MSKKLNKGLNPRVDIDFPISEEVTVKVSYKALKGKKSKELSKKFDPINAKLQEKNKLNKRINLLELKAESLSNLGEDTKVVEGIESLSKLYDKLEVAEEEFNELGGYDAYEEFHKEQFNLSIESKDIDLLIEAIEEESSYFSVMEMIVKAIEEKKGN